LWKNGRAICKIIGRDDSCQILLINFQLAFHWCWYLLVYLIGYLLGFPSRFLGNFKITSSFCPHSVALGFTHHLTEMSTKEFPWG
jgi:hypothetical protein